MENNYYSIACDDIKCMQNSMHLNGYNQIVVLCQQIAEKMLKSVAENVLINDAEDALRTHSLKKIYYMLNQQNPVLHLSVKDLAFLTDFYFDAKYPGDDFINVTKEMCNECLAVTKRVVAEVNKFRKENGKHIEPFRDIWEVDGEKVLGSITESKIRDMVFEFGLSIRDVANISGLSEDQVTEIVNNDSKGTIEKMEVFEE